MPPRSRDHSCEHSRAVASFSFVYPSDQIRIVGRLVYVISMACEITMQHFLVLAVLVLQPSLGHAIIQAYISFL